MKNRQTIIAISGVKNSGKTTLIEKLIRELSRRGISTATIKHDGHGFSPDRPGTDSYRHLTAGAVGAAVFDGEKFQLVKFEQTDENRLLTLFPEAELIMLEGFKDSQWPKLEIVRQGVSDAPVCSGDALLAIVTDRETLSAAVPVFRLDDVGTIADFICRYMKVCPDSMEKEKNKERVSKRTQK
ncbi:MAG: molybdopterin-guanine dinucleotide biosynthesis protein B [Faecousia sp.]